MPTTETGLLKFSRAVAALEFSTDLTHREAVLAILPDWLEWEWCGKEIEWYGLDRVATPAWAAAAWDELTDADREGIEAAAIAKIQKDRREP